MGRCDRTAICRLIQIRWPTSAFSVGDRVLHIKFGNGNVTMVDGNKHTIQFDKAGEKRVVDSFVERV
jgi:DNA helicase-2/ATP-dependent DNA helicase PcrA